MAREGALLAVGAEGSVVRGTPTALVPTRVGDAGDLAAVAGEPGDAIAVGDRGLVVHLGASGSRVLDCELQESLRGVVRELPDGPAFADGSSAVVVRVEPDGACVAEHRQEAAPMLNGIGRGPDGRLLALGDMGSAYVRAEDGTWSPVDSTSAP